MRFLRRWDRHSRRAALAVPLGALLCVAAAAGALRLDPAPVPDPGEGSADPPPRLDGAAGPSDSAVAAAVASAPFRPDREPPDERYRPPGDRRPDADGTDRRLERLRLVGTATRRGGGLAAFEIGRRDVRVLEAGGDVEGFRLVRVEPGGVTLRDEDTTLVLRVERPGGEEDRP